MYICVCKAITDTQIKQAINNGFLSPVDLLECLGVGGSCGKCDIDVKELLNDHHRNQTLMQISPTHTSIIT